MAEGWHPLPFPCCCPQVPHRRCVGEAKAHPASSGRQQGRRQQGRRPCSLAGHSCLAVRSAGPPLPCGILETALLGLGSLGGSLVWPWVPGAGVAVSPPPSFPRGLPGQTTGPPSNPSCFSLTSLKVLVVSRGPQTCPQPILKSPPCSCPHCHLQPLLYGHVILPCPIDH